MQKINSRLNVGREIPLFPSRQLRFIFNEASAQRTQEEA